MGFCNLANWPSINGYLKNTKLCFVFKQQTTAGNTQIGPIKPAFPAYSQANGQSTPSTQPSNTPSGPPDKGETKKPALITTVSANSRIIHPEEDISLVCI